MLKIVSVFRQATEQILIVKLHLHIIKAARQYGTVILATKGSTMHLTLCIIRDISSLSRGQLFTLQPVEITIRLHLAGAEEYDNAAIEAQA